MSISFFLLVMGYSLRYWLLKRQHKRKFAAIQKMRSYEEALRNRYFENAVTAIYSFMILTGAAVLITMLIRGIR